MKQFFLLGALVFCGWVNAQTGSVVNPFTNMGQGIKISGEHYQHNLNVMQLKTM